MRLNISLALINGRIFLILQLFVQVHEIALETNYASTRFVSRHAGVTLLVQNTNFARTVFAFKNCVVFLTVIAAIVRSVSETQLDK